MKSIIIRTAKLAVVALLAGQAGACATIIRGDSQEVTVASSPPGATAQTTLGVTCTTPCAFKAKRKTPFSITISKDGFDPQVVMIRRTFKGGGATTTFVGNGILGGGIGVGVDFATGAPYDLEPGAVSVTLLPAGTTPVIEPAPAPALAEPTTTATPGAQ